MIEEPWFGRGLRVIEEPWFGRELGVTAGPRPVLGRAAMPPLLARGVRVTLPLLARGARLI